ncbi:MMPL family transporter [Phytohabitans houttuyneae]|uniref:Putative membrane protein ActII-3 n=1 Tax=Phytohabitans houttuyneae TaxID=1076126 RepID=A0A6V8KND9_9ACTN|nr:MMPL family transporter [Phytohabitans houttuyneae]GFJ85404.1 putative membrane protein ActII-3 [Phytohabitans houttuyneae]
MSWHWITRLPSGRRTKFLAIALWLVIASAVGPLAVKLADVVTDDAVAWLPRTAEATQAFERAEAAFPGSDRLVAVAVYARDAGLTDADRAKAEADRAAFARYAEGGQVPPAIASEDGKALLLSFPLAGDDDQQVESTGEVRDQLANAPPAGLQTGLTGSAGATDDLFDAFGGMDITLVLVTAGVVALLLLFTYRSPVLWLVPLICVGVASQVASAVVYLLAKHAGLTVDFQGQSVLTVLVFGVGVDYALLLIARYREELRRHRDRHDAMRVALRRSFPAILASAATVAISLLCLLAAELNSTRSLGPVGAVGIAAAFLVMTLLLPAVLVLFGRWLFWPFVPRYSPDAVGHDVAADHGMWARVSAFVGRRPRGVWIGTAAVLGLLTIGIGNLSVGLPGAETFTKEVGSVTGQRIIAAHFPEGSALPAEVVARASAADPVATTLRGVDGVATVAEPQTSADGQWVMIRAVLDAEPDSDAAKATVERMRDAVHAVPGAEALVGGQTAIDLDTDTASSRDERVVIPLILAVVFVILMVLLRALVAPLLLIGSVVLSYAAALGVAGFVLHAMGYTKLFFGAPLQTFLFLVALGVDYTIFLMTRAREEVGQLGHRRGVLHALTVTGGVITSAGLVLAATFAALGILPLVPSVQIGVIVAAGVLLDTFVVRSLLIPALAVHLGPKVWWPGRPAREPAQPASEPVLTRV